MEAIADQAMELLADREPIIAAIAEMSKRRAPDATDGEVIEGARASIDAEQVNAALLMCVHAARMLLARKEMLALDLE
jgi:hypothetical protein